MWNSLQTLILDESKWFSISIGLAIVVTAWFLRLNLAKGRPGKELIGAAMGLQFAVVIGTMAFGHLLAVFIKLTLGTLKGSLPLFLLIGTALAVPAATLASWSWRMPKRRVNRSGTTVGLNAWLGATLLALGLHNLPLAAPALLNIGFALHRRPTVGRVLVALSTLAYAVLFVGSVVFFLSGQSFEQFSGVE